MMGTALQLLFSLLLFYMFVIQQYIIDHKKKNLVLQTMDLM